MGQTYAEIDERLHAFITAQRVFFVATAPAEAGGHVNLSPKGLDSLRILDPRSVAYVDYVGSGIETIAHLRDNGRIVVMFCAFEGPPKIVRLHGRGEALEPGHRKFDRLRAHFAPGGAVRSVIHIALDRISDSCGYGVPEYRYVGERPQLGTWADRKGDAGVRAYQEANNAASIDGLPGLRWVTEGS